MVFLLTLPLYLIAGIALFFTFCAYWKAILITIALVMLLAGLAPPTTKGPPPTR